MIVLDASAAVELLLSPLLQPLQELAQAVPPRPVLAAQSLLHHLSQGTPDVAVLEDIIGQGVEQVVGVGVEALLCPIPAGVSV